MQQDEVVDAAGSVGGTNVHCGSKMHVTVDLSDVRFTSSSGHQL
jgi:hypothetical protein